MKYTNNHDTNNITVTDEGGNVRVLKPGESCELFDSAQAREKSVAASQAKAAENAAKKATAKKEVA